MKKKKTFKPPDLSTPVITLLDRLRIRRAYMKLLDFLLSSKNNRVFNFCLVLLAGFFYVLRAHTYIAHPQLYAEDGEVWLTGGYDHGVGLVFRSYNGLAHTFERLFGFVMAHGAPLSAQPVIYVVAALLIFLLLVYYLFSPRTEILSNNYQKLYVALSLCLLSNAEEFFFSFSNSVFLLGIVGLLLLVAKKPKYRIVGIIEKILFLLLCFTNVFSWIYVLILAFEFIWQRRFRFYYALCALLGAITQFVIHAQTASTRPDISDRLLASKPTLFEFVNQIITPSLRFGRQDISFIGRTGSQTVFVCMAILVVTLIVAFVFYRSNYAVKCFLFFCLLMTLISLKSPINGLTQPAAIVVGMVTYHWGNRYFIFGIIGMFIVWAKFSEHLIKREWLPGFILVFLAFAVISCITLGSFFIQKDFVNLQSAYSNGVAQFEKTKKETIIPINPGDWYVTLKPHS